MIEAVQIITELVHSISESDTKCEREVTKLLYHTQNIENLFFPANQPGIKYLHLQQVMFYHFTAKAVGVKVVEFPYCFISGASVTL